MPTPTYTQWRTVSQSSPGLPPQSLRKRQLSAWATFITGTNPDGTVKGS